MAPLSLAFVQPRGGIGKSFVAAQVSHALAAEGKRVLVVDASVHGDATRALLGERPGDGMASLARKLAQRGWLYDGRVRLADHATRCSDVLHVVAGPAPADAPALDALRLRSAMKDADYDIIIVDTDAEHNERAVSACAVEAADKLAVPLSANEDDWRRCLGDPTNGLDAKQHCPRVACICFNNLGVRSFEASEVAGTSAAVTLSGATIEAVDRIAREAFEAFPSMAVVGVLPSVPRSAMAADRPLLDTHEGVAEALRMLARDLLALA